ncbi:MAG: hypothetical protein RI564_07550 [Gracilimonas sp.]|nr:hypothetical protein [Gracilimonas sp.]
MKSLRPLLLFFTLALSFSLSEAQPYSNGAWEYEHYPNLPFLINDIEMQLTIDPEVPLLKGTAEYRVISRRPNLTEVVFNTSDLDIRRITFGSEVANYRISTDSLIIILPDTLDDSEEISITINWESSSPYGINNDAFGHIWTSLNPQMQNHWLPIPDHPEMKSEFDVSFIIPSDYEVIFNGDKVGEEVLSTEQRQVQWRTEQPVPLVGITAVLGNFVEESARAGVNEVFLWSPEGLLLDEVRNGLMEIAVESIKKFENTFEYEFPYESLQIVILPDHHWEEIQTGAGVIYLYQNLGSLATQLRRGIVTQWLGNFHRYLNPVDERYEFLRNLITGSSQNELLNENSDLETIKYWNKWQKVGNRFNNEFQINTILKTAPELVKQHEGVTSWEEYADLWYDETGIYWYNVVYNAEDQERTSKSAIVYDVEYLYDEVDNELTLVFNSDATAAISLVSLEATAFGFADTTKSELTFTGKRDTVDVDIMTGVDYLTLEVKSDQNIELREKKPFIFLVQQLRSSDPGLRTQAAKQIGTFAENPDVQLAIQDVMSNESEPKVKAALLEALASITKGATGTEETFLSSLNAEDQSIRLAAIRSLTYYRDNDRVKNSVRNIIFRSDADTVFEAALNTYKQLSEVVDIISVAERLNKEEKHERVVVALGLTMAEDSTQSSFEIADRYALGEYAYEVRAEALRLLIKYENNEDYWEQTLALLLQDRDPRIRFQSLNAVKHLSSKTTVELIRERLNEEMDPRVRAKIRRML